MLRASAHNVARVLNGCSQLMVHGHEGAVHRHLVVGTRWHEHCNAWCDHNTRWVPSHCTGMISHTHHCTWHVCEVRRYHCTWYSCYMKWTPPCLAWAWCEMGATMLGACMMWNGCHTACLNLVWRKCQRCQTFQNNRAKKRFLGVFITPCRCARVCPWISFHLIFFLELRF